MSESGFSGNIEDFILGKEISQATDQNQLTSLEDMIKHLSQEMTDLRQENNTLKDKIETLNQALRQEARPQRREIQALNQNRPYCGVKTR